MSEGFDKIMEFTASAPIEIKTKKESFESCYFASFESYRRSHGYAFERRSIHQLPIGKSPDYQPEETVSQLFSENVPLLEYEEPPKSSTYESIFNAVNILMGIGILSLPYALKLTGWIIGITLMILFSLATRHTAMTVQKCLDVQVPFNLAFDECRTFGDFVQFYHFIL